MCGIAGIIGSFEDHALDLGLATLRQRGPDGMSATRIDEIAFGSTRLAIVDLENGQQPFHDESGRWVLHGTGEIYNAGELRDLLMSDGVRFRSSCDLEVVVHAWSKWGSGCMGRLNGMFAIALWDRREHELHLFRDPCGQKPLYVHHAPGRFAFASEIRALRAMGVALEFDPQVIASYLALRYVPGPGTAWRNITELPGCHYLKLEPSGEVSMQRISDPGDSSISLNVDTLDALRCDSVNIASRADVPVALYLSGGVDSWLLANANQAHGQALDAITLDFPGALGEGDAAAAIAREHSLRHHRVPWCDQALARLPGLIEQLESPVGDPLIVAFDLLAEAARGRGFKVVLSGEGPDEWFGAYSFHRAAGWAETIHRFGGGAALHACAGLVGCCGPLADAVAGLGQSLGSDGRRRITEWLGGWPRASPEDRANGLRRLFSPREMRSIVKSGESTVTDLADMEPFDPKSANLPLLARALASQERGWISGWVIGRHEKIALARGLEIRMPFLDPRIASLRHPDAKKTWRQCASRAGMPRPGRAKQAFAMPAVEIVRSRVFRDMASGYLNPFAIRQRGWFDAAAIADIERRALQGSFLAAKQWAALVMLEIWARRQNTD